MKNKMEKKDFNISEKEVRTYQIKDLEVRAEGDNQVVVGYASVFNSLSNDLGGFKELISPDAFAGRTEDDVRFLLNHDANYVFGRTTSGTMNLTIDEVGLRYEVEMPDTQAARDLTVTMKRGDINQSSFAFSVEDDSWAEVDGEVIRTIHKVKRLYDASVVTYPAYEQASSEVAKRSMEAWKESEKLKKATEKDKEKSKKEEQDLFKRNLAELRLKIKNKRK